MTRVKLFGALAALAVILGGVAILPHSQGKNTETFTSKIEAVGLTTYGVKIIDPKHPSFSKLIAEKKSAPVTPFSVFVTNDNDKAIASCSLKWEIVMSDGQTVTHFQTKTGTLETVSDGGVARLTEGIPAKGNLLFSLADASGLENQAGAGRGFRVGGGTASITDQLSRSVKVAVSVDGILFTDGTYVGPDTNNYFELFRGQIEANRDLDGEIDRLVNSGATPEAIATHLKGVSSSQSSDVQILPGEDPQYAFGKWRQKKSRARILLLMREKRGDQAVLDRVHAELADPPISLRKLKEN
jgi:hypothetical protein